MTRYISIWKVPRSRGTAITYGLYNGLREQGLSCVYQNEPLHWRRLEPFRDDPDGFAEYFATTDGSRDLDGVDVVVQKRNAKWIYDPRHGHRFESLSWIQNLTNVFLLRNLADVIHDHRTALEQAEAQDTPEALTLDVLGLPQLFWIHRYCRDRAISTPVFDSDALLVEPKRGMRRLCDAVGVNYDPAMIEWGEVDLDVPPWGDAWHKEFVESRKLWIVKPRSQIMDDPSRLYERAKPLDQRLRSERGSS